MNPKIKTLTPDEIERNQKLKNIGMRLARTDYLLVHLMARRINLALKVAAAKHPTGSRTVRLNIEHKRLKEVSKWARDDGVNSEFPRSLLYMIIGESCKVQADYRERIPRGQKIDYSLPKLRKNLLILTKRWAPIYDRHYAHESEVKNMHLAFEHNALLQTIEKLTDHNRGLIVDIGCATGRESFQHVHSFRRVIGYDVSPDMLRQARANAVTRGGKNRRVEFVEHDIEMGIPLSDSSASCIFMNHGTASDIPNIKQVLLEVRRVLKPGGVFLFSFYNAEALMYQTFLPWPPVLGAEVNKAEHYIEVACKGKILPVYAQAYSLEEIQRLMPPHLVFLNTATHPTVGSIIPKDMFEGKEDARGLDAVKSIDQGLAQGNLGAYIVLTGIKV